MSEEKKDRKWNPKDLYARPEFPEDEGKVTRYEETEAQGRSSKAAMIVAAAALVAFSALVLTGVIRVPLGTRGQEGSAGAAAGQAVSQPVPAAGMPVISELMTSNNNAFAADNGKYYDWIELYNPTDHAVSLAGFGLSDDPDKPFKFVLPDYTLQSGAFVVVYATGGKPAKKRIESSFKLKASGSLVLTDAQGKKVQRIDYVNVPQGSSFAADMGDFTKWANTTKFTPGYPNTEEGYAAFLAANPSPKPTE